MLPAPVFSAGAECREFSLLCRKSSEIADLGPGVVKRRKRRFCRFHRRLRFQGIRLNKFANSQNRLPERFQNDSDTTLAARFRHPISWARISSAGAYRSVARVCSVMPPIQALLDSRPRASATNFTSDNRPVREDHTHRDDSVVSGTSRSSSDDRRSKALLPDREFQPRFSGGKTGTASRPYEDNKPGGFKNFSKPGEDRRRRDRSFSRSEIRRVIAVRTNLTANVGTTTANRTVTRHSIKLTVNAVSTIKSVSFRGGRPLVQPPGR